MFDGNLTGRSQKGGRGLGFRGNSPPWPYVGRGRGGLPRCSYFPDSQVSTTAQGITREQEINLLKNQAENIKKDLNIIESRIRELEANK